MIAFWLFDLRSRLTSLALVLTIAHAAAEENVDGALKKAGAYLLSQQVAKSGAIRNKERNEAAMTSLAILALTSLGHQPADATPEGRALKNALGFVLRPDAQAADGYFGLSDGSRMYGHGIITLMLSEMLGMGADAAQDELIREKCRRAIELILKAQKAPKDAESNRGGWRYEPNDRKSDMSVTVWQTMALRSAKNAGFDIPGGAIEDAVAYIKGLYEADKGRTGEPKLDGFGYQSRGRMLSTTTEGLLALQVCGEYESPEVKGAADRLLIEGLRQEERWMYYTTYYYAQGMYQRGGKHAAEGRRVVAELLLPLQTADGSWEPRSSDEKQGGTVYATSLAVLSLAVKNHFLPIYQR